MSNKTKAFGRSIEYVVLPVAAVRMNNIRSNDEVVEAQKSVSTEMISALEEMVHAAKASRLEGTAALALRGVAW